QLKSMIEGSATALNENSESIAAWFDFLVQNGAISVDAIMASLEYFQDNAVNIFINMITVAKNFFMNLPEMSQIALMMAINQFMDLGNFVLGTFENIGDAAWELGRAIVAALVDPL